MEQQHLQGQLEEALELESFWSEHVGFWADREEQCRRRREEAIRYRDIMAEAVKRVKAELLGMMQGGG